MRFRSFALLAMAVALVSAAALPVSAHDGPHHGNPDIRMVLVEHAIHITNIDQGEQGPSIGDLVLWGPNPMYDETNSKDIGATTQGTCTAFEPGGDCILLETILFSNGSTLHLQGIQPGQPERSTRMIVGGSGDYLGAMGTVTVEPTDDLTQWTKTFEIWFED